MFRHLDSATPLVSENHALPQDRHRHPAILLQDVLHLIGVDQVIVAVATTRQDTDRLPTTYIGGDPDMAHLAQPPVRNPMSACGGTKQAIRPANPLYPRSCSPVTAEDVKASPGSMSSGAAFDPT